ncbi:quinate permease [Penicillium verhagenii]|uniref:quinate permease n=1 Tax=Penicillium verhagenii TaxID=1562060 RepID=UPI00254535A0|nr:quinate permease [Penicillium verhagenii]KAJ5915449.1 quinate permease [Penicillium verhagenii]
MHVPSNSASAPGDVTIAELRLQQANAPGISGLFKNKKVFLIALFASFGGLEYGYQQGVISQALVMSSFKADFPDIVGSSGATGWLTSILQLGGWFGALSAGVLAEVFTRKHTILSGALWVILGSFLSAGAHNGSYLFAGRFLTGIGVGTLSAVGPLYNAELAPPEIRGLLVALQQLSTTIGIMIAYWIGYGTNYIGGTGDGQSDWAWRTPLIIQGIPAIILVLGAVFFLPFSPRMLVSKGREEEALKTLASLRGLPEDDIIVRGEFLEIKSEVLFEQRVFAKTLPHLAEPGHSLWRRELAQYTNIFRTKDNFKRVAIAGLIMFFQQWSGVDSIIYYASSIFQSLGLTSGTISLLATGVVGIINVLATIPAAMIIDKVGRKPLLLAGSTGMFCSMIIVAVIVAKCQHDWEQHTAAGWAAVAFIWIYIANFGYSWGPASWVLIAEIFPLSIRAKGTSIGASSNWMNNFIVALIVPPMIAGIGWGMYLFFAVWLLIGAIFIWLFVPETKNKTLEEMDLVFGSVAASDDQDMFSAVKEEVGLTALLKEGESTGLSGDNYEKGVSTGHLETA